MVASLFDESRYQRLRKNFLIFLISCMAFSTFIYMPVYWLLYSDVRWSDSAVLLMWNELVEPLMNYTFYLGSFAFVIHAAARFGTASAAPFCGFYGGAAFLRYVTNLFSYMWIMGAIHVSGFMTYDLPDMLFSTAIDLLQMGIAFWIAHACTKKNKYVAVERITALNNPSLRAAAWISVIPACTQLLSRFYYDMQLIFTFHWKVDGMGEVLLMVSYYLTDLLAVPVGFLAMALVLRRMGRSETRAREIWEDERKTKK